MNQAVTTVLTVCSTKPINHSAKRYVDGVARVNGIESV